MMTHLRNSLLIAAAIGMLAIGSASAQGTNQPNAKAEAKAESTPDQKHHGGGDHPFAMFHDPSFSLDEKIEFAIDMMREKLSLTDEQVTKMNALIAELKPTIEKDLADLKTASKADRLALHLKLMSEGLAAKEKFAELLTTEQKEKIADLISEKMQMMGARIGEHMKGLGAEVEQEMRGLDPAMKKMNEEMKKMDSEMKKMDSEMKKMDSEMKKMDEKNAIENPPDAPPTVPAK